MTIEESLTNEINSAMITFENHSKDNSFVDCDLKNFKKYFGYTGYEPYGVCRNVPFNYYPDEQVAYVFKEDEEIKWVHIPKLMWRYLLSDIYGREKAKEIVS